jgi:isochorismate synthase
VFFWQDGEETCIALGALEVVEAEGPGRFAQADARFRALHAERPELRGLRWFGGFAFEDTAEPGPFRAFGALRFVLPAIVWRRRAGAGAASVHMPLAADRDGGLWPRALAWARSEPRSPRPYAAGARVIPGAVEAWEDAVAAAHDAFDAGWAEKIVLSRDIFIERPEPVDPARVLAALEPRSPSEAAFLMRARRASFLGLSPERLVCVGRDRVVSEAVAGSSGPEDPDGRALLESAKDRREHQHVVDHLLRRIAPFVLRPEAPEGPVVRRLGHLTHLLTPVEGVRRGAASVLEVASALHPTPAVGGVPLEPAREVIGSAEGRPRGWYTGAVGWVEPDARGSGLGDLRVALRSAVVEGRSARAFVGAGLVPASTAEGEWRETALKARRLVAALGGGDG